MNVANNTGLLTHKKSSMVSCFVCVGVCGLVSNAGLLVVPVSAHNTSQDCSNCGEKVPKKLHIRWHDCPHCGCSLDRDHNAAINIKNKAVGQSVFKAKSLLSNSRIVLEAHTNPKRI